MNFFELLKVKKKVFFRITEIETKNEHFLL